MSVKTVYAICDVMPPDALAGLIAAIDALDEPTAEQMQLRECADTTLCELLGEQSADELIERFKNGTR